MDYEVVNTTFSFFVARNKKDPITVEGVENYIANVRDEAQLEGLIAFLLFLRGSLK